jgi:transcriptional regulator with XRE-family HTH domain
MRTADPAHVIQAIGRRIGELRAAKGLSQAQLAEALGIALQGVQRMEQGRQNLTVKTIVKLANKLGCNPRDLWDPPTSAPTRGRPPAPTARRARAKRSDS